MEIQYVNVIIDESKQSIVIEINNYEDVLEQLKEKELQNVVENISIDLLLLLLND